MVDFQNLDLLINEEIQNACLLIFRPIENQLAETYMHRTCTHLTNQDTSAVPRVIERFHCICHLEFELGGSVNNEMTIS